MKTTSFVVGALLCSSTIMAQISGVKGTDKSASEGEAIANSITATSFTNDYTAVCGEFTGTFGIQVGPNLFPVNSNGGKDIFVQVMFQDDFHNWGRTIGGPGEDRGVEVLKDDDNVYIAGVFSETVDFDPQQGTAIRTSSGGTDIFLLCLNRFGGNFNWVKTFGGPEDDLLTSMDWYYDENGIKSNLYLTGSFQGRADFQPGKLRLEKSSNGGKDCFVSSFLPNGWFQWVKTWGGEMDDQPEDISVQRKVGTSTVELAVCGTFQSHVDFDPGIGVFNLSTSNNPSARAGFLMKLDAFGNFGWAGEFDSPLSIGGFLMDATTTTFDDLGNIYVSGIFDVQTDFDFGAGTYLVTHSGAASNGFLAKYDNTGGFVWVNKFTSSNGHTSPTDSDVAANKVYLVGYYNTNSDFDPNVVSSGELIATAASHTFVVRHDLSGNFEWAKEPDASVVQSNHGRSIEAYAQDCNARISFCGDFGDAAALDIDPEVTTFNITDNFNIDNARSGFTALWVDDICEAKEPGNSSNARVDLQPNPSTDGVAQIVAFDDDEILGLQVLNTGGSSVEFEQTVRGKRGQIKLLDAVPGVYYIVVSTRSGTKTLKWVVI